MGWYINFIQSPQLVLNEVKLLLLLIYGFLLEDFHTPSLTYGYLYLSIFFISLLSLSRFQEVLKRPLTRALLKKFSLPPNHPPFFNTLKNTLKICQSKKIHSKYVKVVTNIQSALADFQKPARCDQIITKKGLLQLLTLSAQNA